MFYLNVNGPMRLTRRLVPSMKLSRVKGAIVNIGSIAGIDAMNGTGAAYAAAKHAIVGRTRGRTRGFNDTSH